MISHTKAVGIIDPVCIMLPESGSIVYTGVMQDSYHQQYVHPVSGPIFHRILGLRRLGTREDPYNPEFKDAFQPRSRCTRGQLSLFLCISVYLSIYLSICRSNDRCVHVPIYVHICTCMYVCLYVCMCMCIYVYMYTHTYIHIYICIYTYTHVHLSISVCIYIYIYIQCRYKSR